jgi:GntR family transcriptional regulator
LVQADANIAAILRVKVGQLLFQVKRLRLANGEPLAIENALISFFGCENLMEEDLAHNSLYQMLAEKYGQAPVEADQELEARLASEEDARLLMINKGDPVLHTRRTTYTDRNQPLEYATSVYRGDKYRFYTRLNRK